MSFSPNGIDMKYIFLEQDCILHWSVQDVVGRGCGTTDEESNLLNNDAIEDRVMPNEGMCLNLFERAKYRSPFRYDVILGHEG
jgi:hypothetical protein